MKFPRPRWDVLLTAVLLAGGSIWIFAAEPPSAPTFLNQNWTQADRQWYYSTPQGSHLVPYSWFLALERPDSEESFLSDGLARFGYLPNPANRYNPDRLPVGFVKDQDKNGVWLGMTCAACHTNQIRYRGRTLQIDGAPTAADMYAFLAEMGQALQQTRTDEAKFDRFARQALGSRYNPANLGNLRANLQRFTNYYSTFIRDSTPDHPWGPARLDAFGMIFNRVSSIDLGLPQNSRKPNAPVSYPFLWGTSWHDKVQWNGSAPNELMLERLGRNVGEVLGVFAEVDLRKPPARYYPSSIKRINLIEMEQKLESLRSPRWPAQYFGAIDPGKAAKGKALYQNLCSSCHSIAPRDRPRKTKVVMTPLSVIGTDPVMATSVLNRTAETGRLKGTRENILFGERRLRDQEPVIELVRVAVLGSILSPVTGLSSEEAEMTKVPADPREALRSVLFTGAMRAPQTPAERKAGAQLKRELQNVFQPKKRSPPSDLLAYKARPLDGIWATAPYLHNGSVPNLYQMLLPPERRDSHFYVGSPEFDPKHVGFDTREFDRGFRFDTTLPGNSNAGHAGKIYGTDSLTDEQRWQLVEYLKTL